MYGNALIDAIFLLLCVCSDSSFHFTYTYGMSFVIPIVVIFRCVCVQTEPIGLLSSSIRKKQEFYLDLISIHV